MSRAAAAVSPATPPPPSAWSDVVARYLEALRLTHYAADTVHIRALYLKYFTTWATARGLTAPTDITPAGLERYQRWLYHYRKRTGTPLSVWSQHGRLVAVKGLFRWLTKQRILAVNPAAELELPRVTAQRLPQPLTDAEIIAVLARVEPTTPIGLRNRALLETGYSTGLRRMELIRLRLYDLDLARGVVVVREGKGQKDRVVPIGDRAIAWLEKYLDEARPEFVVEPDEGTVFLTRRGRPFHPNNLSRLTRDYLEAAGIAKRGACHLLRHTMATGMLEHGADVRVIQEILGHARLTTTQLYTRVSIRLLKAVHTATHPAATLARRPRRQPPAWPPSHSRNQRRPSSRLKKKSPHRAPRHNDPRGKPDEVRAMEFDRITVDPRQMGGVPCLRRLRIPVATVVGMVADGMSEDAILQAYPDLEREDIREALRYAAAALQERELPLLPSR